jgi:hypothetical protein
VPEGGTRIISLDRRHFIHYTSRREKGHILEDPNILGKVSRFFLLPPSAGRRDSVWAKCDSMHVSTPEIPRRPGK